MIYPPLLLLCAYLVFLVTVCNGLSFNFNNLWNGVGTTNRPSSSSSLPPSNVKLLILPGFGNESTDYTMPGSLVDSLREMGWRYDGEDAAETNQIAVLPIQRIDWLQVFVRGGLDWNFWMGNADPTRPAFRWYLERISEQIELLCNNDDNNDDDDSMMTTTRVILVGHSAGGWLGRAAMGFGSDSGMECGIDDGSRSPSGPPIQLDRILGFVSLGAPHLPPPQSVMDMTRGALRITDERFPGVYHADRNGIFYVTVIGLAIRGVKQQRQSPFEPTTATGFAYNSYEAVSGDGTALGDGVVPCCAAHLHDAVQIDLDGVLHSINAPNNWYGSSRIIDRWHGPMLRELQRTLARRRKQTATGRYAQNDVIATISNVWNKLFKP